MQPQPERIISARVFAKRIGISRAALAKHLRRGLINAAFTADCGSFFRPEQILPAKRVIALNRRKQWRHVTSAA
jgi:hypothetical protein